MPAKHNTDVEKLRRMTDAEIEAGIAQDPDTFVPDALFWEKAEIVMPSNKQQITLKLDPEVLAFFRRGGRGCNTRINAVLKSYIEAQQG
jgi:uncharacterized protein (DUF4415 family)